jgi:DNA-directed RNA polymerase specialized sigma24 family protein
VRSSRLDEVTTSEWLPAGGHPAWLVELFQANVSAAFNVAYRLVWNRADAQDVVQTSFIKATRSISQLRDASKARCWLINITYREALMVLRSRRDLPTDPFALPDPDGRHLPGSLTTHRDVSCSFAGR